MQSQNNVFTPAARYRREENIQERSDTDRELREWGRERERGPGLRRPFVILDPANLPGTKRLEHLNLPLKEGRRGTHRSLLQDISVSKYLKVFLGYAGCVGKEPSRIYESCLLYKQETRARLSVLQLLCWWNTYENSWEATRSRGQEEVVLLKTEKVSEQNEVCHFLMLIFSGL